MAGAITCSRQNSGCQRPVPVARCVPELTTPSRVKTPYQPRVSDPERRRRHPEKKPPEKSPSPQLPRESLAHQARHRETLYNTTKRVPCYIVEGMEPA
jgi:hypothetical protein